MNKGERETANRTELFNKVIINVQQNECLQISKDLRRGYHQAEGDEGKSDKKISYKKNNIREYILQQEFKYTPENY